MYSFSNRLGKSSLPLNYTPFEVNGPLASSTDSVLSFGISRPYSDENGDLNGSMDDLRIFSRELNATEVSLLYNNGIGDFLGETVSISEKDNVLLWKDFSGSNRMQKNLLILQS